MNPSPSLAAAAPVGRRRPSHAPALATIAGAVLLPSLVMLAWILVRNGGQLIPARIVVDLFPSIASALPMQVRETGHRQCGPVLLMMADGSARRRQPEQ